MATINGTNGNDDLAGTSGADGINPLLGNDAVDGAGGSDTLIVDYSAAQVDPYASVGAANATSIISSNGGSFNGVVITPDSGNRVAFSDIEHLQIKLDFWHNRFVIDGSALALGATLSLDGGQGDDTLEADLSALAGVNLQVGPGGTTASFATVTNVEIFKLTLTDGADNISTGSGDDTLTGNGGSDMIAGGGGLDKIDGGEGNDNLWGEAGDDNLTGGPGNDRIEGGTGLDVMEGGADNDTYVVSDIGDLVIENVGGGADTVETSLGVGSTQAERQAAQYQLGVNVENLVGTLDSGQGLRGNGLNNVIIAGSGADYVNASNGGNDTVSVGNGRDVIYYGGALTDADTNNGGDEGGDARGDLLVIQGDYTLTLGADALVDIEKFRLLRGENTSFGDTASNLYDYAITTVDANVTAGAILVVQGGSLQLGETLTFNGSAELDGSFKIFGGRDADALTGGAQDDHLLGRSGDDTLTGNGGADRLRGGLGGDTMDGGSGVDTFVYAAQGGDEPYSVAALESTGLSYDTIIGFNFAEDKIDLPGSVSSLASVGSGALSDASFDTDLASVVDGSLAANGAVLFTASSGGHSGETFLVVDADGNGAYQVNLDFVIQLGGAIGVPGTADFFL